MQRWEKAREKYYDGKPNDAAREVAKILDDNPDDAAAQQWLQWYENNASDLPTMEDEDERRWND